MLRQLTDSENDLAVVGLFLTALAYSLRHARRGRRSDLAFASVTLGLLAGVKYYALGYAVVAAATLVLLTVALRGFRAGAGPPSSLSWECSYGAATGTCEISS